MLTLLQFVTGYIPQGFTFVLAIYAICKTKINYKNYLLSSILLVIIIWLFRTLLVTKQVTPGVHMLINMLALICLSTFINNLPLMNTVIGCLSISVAMLFIELLNIATLSLFYGGENYKKLSQNAEFTAVTAIPPMAIFTIAVVIFYFMRVRKRGS